MLCVLAFRSQTLHLLTVQEGPGRFAEEARVGGMCRADDELVIATARDAEAAYTRRVARRRAAAAFPPPAETRPPDRSRVRRSPSDEDDSDGSVPDTGLDRMPPVSNAPVETGLGGGKRRLGFYTGLMQRLLVYVYRRYHRDGRQGFFYRVVGQYNQLIMNKAQFLDEDHLLIRLGSHERSPKPSDGTHNNTSFFVVYCVSSTEIVNLFENRSSELLSIYERYRDLFIGDGAVYATLPETRGPPRDGGALNARPWGARSGAGSSAMRDSGSAMDGRVLLKWTRAELAGLPVTCQTGNVSVYLDRGMFSYNEERMSGLNGTRAVSLRDVNAVKFIGASSGRLRFKLAPGMAAVSAAGRGRRENNGISPAIALHRRKKALFLFHPTLPFVISMEIGVIGSTVYNFHVYGFQE